MQLQKSAIARYPYSSAPIALYNSQQVYAIEQAWFAQGYDSFALMQQAAWQMTQHIIRLNEQANTQSNYSHKYCHQINRQPRACIWVGQGNNGGDGWLIAYYLQQAGWQVQVMTVGLTELKQPQVTKSEDKVASLSDAVQAQRIAIAAHCSYQQFENSQPNLKSQADVPLPRVALQADVYVDAIFGIGLDRAPKGIYKQAIIALNQAAQQAGALVVAVDIPSGLVASSGQVFECLAVQADVTLCLIARKFGLHTKDGMDYAGAVIDIPLIPYAPEPAYATLLSFAYNMTARKQNSYKGSYGHVLIIGGNRIEGSQGMGGAAILSAASAMASGAGKITVACHEAFHGALLTSLPDAMTIDVHDTDGVKQLIEDAGVMAIGMGLGRDFAAQDLFIGYIQAAMKYEQSIIIDADGLYHLASLQTAGHELVAELREYSNNHEVCLTPHSGEAAKLLDKAIIEVEADRLAAIKQAGRIYGGDWVLKGAGSLVMEKEHVYVCSAGNAGMATAGMGDVLSGVIAGLLAQQDLDEKRRSLRQAVLIHGLAGDVLVNEQSNSSAGLFIGQRGLQAQDMPAAIRHIMQDITLKK